MLSAQMAKGRWQTVLSAIIHLPSALTELLLWLPVAQPLA